MRALFTYVLAAAATGIAGGMWYFLSGVLLFELPIFPPDSYQLVDAAQHAVGLSIALLLLFGPLWWLTVRLLRAIGIRPRGVFWPAIGSVLSVALSVAVTFFLELVTALQSAFQPPFATTGGVLSLVFRGAVWGSIFWVRQPRSKISTVEETFA